MHVQSWPYNCIILAFPIGVMIKPKSGYMVRTDEISSPAYQSIGLGKLRIDFVSAEFIAPAIY